jgi:hypothetical protein
MKKRTMMFTILLALSLGLSACAKPIDKPNDDPIVKPDPNPIETVDPLPTSYVLGNTNGNINNNSRFVEAGGWIFYAESQQLADGIAIDNPNYGIWRMKPDGTQRTRISKLDGYCFNASADRIYFINNGISSMKFDGSGLIENIGNAIPTYNKGTLLVNDTFVFISNSDQLIYTMKIDGSKLNKLTSLDASKINFFDGWIFYITETPLVTLRKVRINGTQDTLVSSTAMKEYVFADNEIFFTSIDDSILSVMDLNGNSTVKLSIGGVDLLNTDGKSIIYRSRTDLLVHKIAFDGSSDMKISKNQSNMESISVAGEMIYFTGNNAKTLYRVSLDGNNETSVADIKTISPDPEGTPIIEGVLPGQQFVRNEDWIYTSGINKIHPDGTGKTLVRKIPAHSFSIYGNWIYFINENDRWTIYRMKLDGSEMALVADVTAHNFIIKDGWIYMNMYYGPIAKVKTDGTGFEILQTGIQAQPTLVAIDGDYLYFSGCGEVCLGVYRMKTDGTDFYSFGFTESYVSINGVEDGWVYLFIQDPNTNKSESFRIKADGTREQIFELTDAKETTPYIYDIFDGWIYFYSGKTDETIVRMKMDGSEREVVLGKSDRVTQPLFLIDKLIMQIYKAGADNPTSYIANLDGSGFMLLLK